MTANYLVWLIVRPSQLILIAAILAALCWRWPIGRRFGVAAIAMLLSFGLVPIGAFLLKPLETRFAIPTELSEIDGIIVLAGAELGTLSKLYAQPQLSSAGDRLTTFIGLANAHAEARLVHSGAADSETARAVILGAGIAASRVTFEDQSRNTCESATATHSLIAPSSSERWLLVTSASHLPRAVACFLAVGWEVIPYPTDFQSGGNPLLSGLTGNLEAADAAAHEWLGLVWYRLRGYTEVLYPGATRT